MDISYIDTTITRLSALPGICGTDRHLAGFLLRHIPAPSGSRFCSPSTSTPRCPIGILGAISISPIRHPGTRSGLHHFAIDGHDDLAQRVSKIL
ncbi:hypothetical protein B0H15DRAFT_950360 [Mycena belliarum]|uniref:Uncharacterized protein n=1 Tax=Mycena belliarum TaxID=1033014 RepID=A0AAD6U3X2_9AGAR|nr:hypothetical protein B0H15DRAFT_950360 [Mycena belliae]